MGRLADHHTYRASTLADHVRGGSLLRAIAGSTPRCAEVLDACNERHPTCRLRMPCPCPDSHIATSVEVHQWRERAGFSRTLPPPRSRNSQLLDLCEHIVASLVVDVDSLGVTPRQMGSPSGYTSDRSGPGAGRPSSNRLGISRALLFVEQSMAAAMKITSSSWLLRDCCRLSSARSWLGSRSQSTVKQRQPQLMKALVLRL
jgi:hypothetical protein